MHITLFQFKNYNNKTLGLEENIQVIIGNNGAGKSTLCEALSIAINAANPHHTSWEEKVSFGDSPSPFERESGGGREKDGMRVGASQGVGWALRLHLRDELFQTIYDGKSHFPKWSIDEETCSKPKYESRMPYRAFWITGDHLRIISGEPSERRNFLDDMLAYGVPGYHDTISRYRKALTSRNKVIESIQEKFATKKDLVTWDVLLAESALRVIAERRKFFDWLNCPPDKGGLGGVFGNEKNFLNLPGPIQIKLAERHPIAQVSKEYFLALLEEYKDRDIAAGRTTVGPHLDDVDFLVKLNTEWKPTKYTLSRGENKILLLAFVREIGEYVHELSGKKSLFLLDDVLSDLDQTHVGILCDLFAETTTIMTTQPNHVAGVKEEIARIVL